jgi:uncharacterized membrane protein
MARLRRQLPDRRQCALRRRHLPCDDVVQRPRNNALAALDATTPEAAALWTNYLSTWTSWTHVCTLAALVATFLFALALRARS